jgi:hypothetical protein
MSPCLRIAQSTPLPVADNIFHSFGKTAVEEYEARFTGYGVSAYFPVIQECHIRLTRSWPYFPKLQRREHVQDFTSGQVDCLITDIADNECVADLYEDSS